MPRNQGTSRKGKPKKQDRISGMGRALQKAQGQKYRPRMDGKNRRGDGGMEMQPGVESIGLVEDVADKTRSVLELQDLDDFLLQADIANRHFATEHQGMVILDATSQAYYPAANKVKWMDQEPKQPSFTFSELSVPRRPAWDTTTSAEELQKREKEAFLEWRRGIAQKEESLLKQNIHASVTPFEKNLEVWRQLWRVLERSSCLLQLVDARNPLFYLSDDLREYAASQGKPMMVLLNKSDYLSKEQRKLWYDYLQEKGWKNVAFFSAVLEQQKIDAAAQEERRKERLAADNRLKELEQEEKAALGISSIDDDSDDEGSQDDSTEEKKLEEEEAKKPDEKVIGASGEQNLETTKEQSSLDGIGIDTPLTRQQLLDVMIGFAQQHDCKPNPKFDNRIQFGMVGFPNVGKSSVINVLVGSSKHAHGVVRVAVASQPGKTKHFQTLLLPDSDDIMLCDCPGLVFPSFVSNTADLIAAGVYPIAQMRDHWPVMNLICERIPRPIIEAQYGIRIPVPPLHELKEHGWKETDKLPPPTPEEFLGTLCVARGMLAANSGVPDYQKASRMVIKDYAAGRLLYCHPPPQITTTEELDRFYKETVTTAVENTTKLRERLLKQQQLQEENLPEVEQEETGTENPEDLIDDDLLELLGGAPQPKQTQPKKQRGKNFDGDVTKHGKKGRTPKQKWGKKDRKRRDNDPYGCHSTPDESVFGSSGISGVTVQAGRYSQAGYTRPKTFPSAAM